MQNTFFYTLQLLQAVLKLLQEARQELRQVCLTRHVYFFNINKTVG